MSVKVRNEITVYEDRGTEVPLAENHLMVIESHWNRPDMVVISVNGTSVTVAGSDLQTAILNATRNR